MSPGFGPTNATRVGPQALDVAARGRVRPHERVHRRGGEDGLVGGEEHGGGEVVGHAAGHAREERGGGRGDEEQVGLRERRMWPISASSVSENSSE
jgi:hypothetical protein